MNAVVAIPREATNPSQKTGVHWVATILGELFVIERSRYMRYALTLPPTVPASAKIAGTFSQINRSSPRIRTETINTGTNQSAWSPSRARSKPLTESFIPTQLSCTQGKKKHIKTKAAKLNVKRRVLFIISFGSGRPFWLSENVTRPSAWLRRFELAAIAPSLMPRCAPHA